MEIKEDRHGHQSTTIASQLPIASWYDIISEASIADAVLDRLIHTSHKIDKGYKFKKKTVKMSVSICSLN